MGTERTLLIVAMIVSGALATVGLLVWSNFKDYTVLGFIGCVAVFASVYLIGLRYPRR